MLESLVQSYRVIKRKLPFYEESNSNFTTALNSQTKVARSILDCISLMRDPKLQLSSSSRGKMELARMMEAVQKAEEEVKKVQLLTYKDSSGRVIRGKKINSIITKN